MTDNLMPDLDPAAATAVAAQGSAPVVRPNIAEPATGQTGQEHLIAYTGLKGSAPSAPDPVMMDVTPNLPWDGLPGAALLVAMDAQEVVAGPPVLRSHVVRMKKIAEAQAREGLDLTGFVPALRKETEGARTDLGKLTAAKAAAVALKTLTPQQIDGVDALQAAPRAEAHAKIRAAVERVASDALTKLAKAEHEAMEQIEHGSVQPTEADYTQATELSATLNLLPVSLAVPLLTKRLVENPAASGKGLGLVAAMIPLLQGKHDTDPQWNDPSSGAMMLLTQCEAVVRDSNFYRGHMRLTAVHQLKLKVQELASDYAHVAGDERAGAFLAARQPFFADLGMAGVR